MVSQTKKIKIDITPDMDIPIYGVSFKNGEISIYLKSDQPSPPSIVKKGSKLSITLDWDEEEEKSW